MTKEEFLKGLYCDPADRSYANRYVQASVIMENTPENKKEIEDFLYDESKLSMGIDAFFGYMEEINDNICIFHFSIGKGCIDDGRIISEIIPDSVVVTVNSWDDYDFAVYSNIKETEDYTLNLNIDGPFDSCGKRVNKDKTLIEDCYYDIEAEILIDFQGMQISVDGGGGGLCSRGAYEYYLGRQRHYSIIAETDREDI